MIKLFKFRKMEAWSLDLSDMMDETYNTSQFIASFDKQRKQFPTI